AVEIGTEGFVDVEEAMPGLLEVAGEVVRRGRHGGETDQAPGRIPGAKRRRRPTNPLATPSTSAIADTLPAPPAGISATLRAPVDPRSPPTPSAEPALEAEPDPRPPADARSPAQTTPAPGALPRPSPRRDGSAAAPCRYPGPSPLRRGAPTRSVGRGPGLPGGSRPTRSGTTPRAWGRGSGCGPAPSTAGRDTAGGTLAAPSERSGRPAAAAGCLRWQGRTFPDRRGACAG